MQMSNVGEGGQSVTQSDKPSRQRSPVDPSLDTRTFGQLADRLVQTATPKYQLLSECL